MQSMGSPQLLLAPSPQVQEAALATGSVELEYGGGSLTP